MITTLTNVAIQDQTTPANIVYLENIMEGVDGAAAFGLTIEKAALTVSNNQELQYKHTYTFDVRVIDPSNADIDLLQVMVDEQRPVKISGYGPDGFLIIDGPVLLNYNRQFDQIVAMPILATITATSGYQGAAPSTKLPVYAGDNMLGVYDVTGGGSNALNGFVRLANAGFNGTLPSAGVMRITTADGNALNNYQSSQMRLFPYAGQVLTLSLNVTDVSITSNGFQAGLAFYNAAGGLISVAAGNISIDSAGAYSGSYTTPAGTIMVSPYFRAAGAQTASDYFEFEKPMVSISGKSTFTL